jgi:hypothetical protein
MNYTQTSFQRTMGPSGGISTAGSGAQILGKGGGGGDSAAFRSALEKREERERETGLRREAYARLPDEVKQMRKLEEERQRSFFTGSGAQMAAAGGGRRTMRDYEDMFIRDQAPGKDLNKMRPEERNMWLEKAGRFR